MISTTLVSPSLKRRSFFFASLGVLLSCQSRKPTSNTPRRIVSLSPSTTEALFALGAEASVVGRSRYCDYPPEAEKITQVGGITDPNVETILALHPDLIVGARGPAGPSVAQRFETRGITTFFPPTESLAEIDAMMQQLSERIGRREGYLHWHERYQYQRKQIEENLRLLTPPRVLLLFGLTPVVAAGPGSFADEMLRLSQAENVLKIRATTAYPTLSMEQVIALEPEIILNAAVMESRTIPTEGAWGAVRAVREGRVRTLHGTAVLRPGPRVLEGVMEMARVIHPEAHFP